MTVLTTLAGERPQLAIVDIVLPGRNGVELARQIREEFPDQRVLYMSAYPRGVLAREGLEEGAETFLAKPFTPEQLLQRVEEALARPGTSEAPAIG
jgi:two-component system phosphate regulon response regulator OmpR